MFLFRGRLGCLLYVSLNNAFKMSSFYLFEFKQKTRLKANKFDKNRLLYLLKRNILQNLQHKRPVFLNG